MTKKHGNTGNQNAHKEVRKEATVYILCTVDEKNRWVRQAQSENMKLSAWVRKHLNQALK